MAAAVERLIHTLVMVDTPELFDSSVQMCRQGVGALMRRIFEGLSIERGTAVQLWNA